MQLIVLISIFSSFLIILNSLDVQTVHDVYGLICTLQTGLTLKLYGHHQSMCSYSTSMDLYICALGAPGLITERSVNLLVMAISGSKRKLWISDVWLVQDTN